MNLKIGRRIYEVDQNDVIFDNSACYQLITKHMSLTNRSYPVITGGQFKKLLKENAICLVNESLVYMTDEGKEMWHRYYKFNV